MKSKIIKFVFFAIIFIILIILITSNTKKSIDKIKFEENIQKYGNPIDKNTGEINNNFFDIYSDNTNADKTTKGLNAAIEYASKNNIEKIKLSNGEYRIIAEEDKGIILKSNIELDLNGAKLIAEPNNYEKYSALTIKNAENVIVRNGTIIGDKEEHIYNLNGTSQWGFGITIRNSQFINIENLNISGTTGDGIYVTKDKNKNNSKNINIYNCDINQCRRQGISVISGENIKIYNNEIHDINGTNPQAAIDLESNNNEQKINNIEIYNNKLYNFGNEYAIKIQRYVYTVNVYNNIIEQSIVVFDAKNKVSINNNTINNGDIILYNRPQFEQQGQILQRVVVENNTINNGKIDAKRVKNLKINKNYIINGNVYVVSSNTVLTNNIVKADDETFDYAYKIDKLNYSDVFYVYKYNNTSFGNIKVNEIINEDKALKITNNISYINAD